MADQREQVDYFLETAEAKGESQQQGFDQQIKVLSWSFGGHSESTVGRTSGSGAGKVTMHPLNIVVELDSGYTHLAGFLTKGTHLTSATLSAVKNGSNNQAYITIKMTEVFVAKLGVQASTGVPVVNIALTYKSINTQYKKQTAQGDLVAAGTHSYDATTNVTS